MAEKDWLLGDSPNPLGDRVDEFRAKLKDCDPEKLAARTGVVYIPKGGSTPNGIWAGEFKLAFWSREVILKFPDFTGKYTFFYKNRL